VRDGFIDEYIEIVSQITDAPPLFVRASAYWLTSLLFGVNVVCPLAPPGASRVNIWFMLSGPPAITRKSTVIDKLARRFFERLFTKYLMNKLQITEHEAWKISKLVFIEKATPEGLADHIQITSGEGNETLGISLDRYSLITTEFGGIVAACERDYMTGFAQLLSKLYYGEGDVTYLSSRKGKKDDRMRVIPEGLYVCALVGIQKLNLYIKPELVKQGLLRRFIVIHQDGTDKPVRKPPLDPTRKIVYTEFEDLVERYLDMMENYNQFDPQRQGPVQVFVRMNKSVMDKINEYWDQCEREYLNNQENLWLLYKQSSWEHLLKLTILEAISRVQDPEYRFGDLELKVEIQDFERALNFLTQAHYKSQIEISSIEASPVDQFLPVASGKLNFVFNIIESSGEEGISRSELLVKTGLLKDELKRLIITLMEQERIVAYKFSPPTGGRSLIKFFSKKYEKKLAISGGQFISVDQLEIIW